MTQQELEKIIDSIFPKLLGFSSSLTSTADQAQQTLIDAYTVFVLREKNFISKMEAKLEDRVERLATKRYFLNELLKEIYDLAQMRKEPGKIDHSKFREYENFFDLNLQKRAILYLKNKQNMSIEDLQEIFTMQRHQVIELLHNSYYKLIKDVQYNQVNHQEQV